MLRQHGTTRESREEGDRERSTGIKLQSEEIRPGVLHNRVTVDHKSILYIKQRKKAKGKVSECFHRKKKR